MQREMPEHYERARQLPGHAPKELWVHHDQSRGADRLIESGEAVFCKWEHGLEEEGNYAMVRDAERLVAMVGRWAATGTLPDELDDASS